MHIASEKVVAVTIFRIDSIIMKLQLTTVIYFSRVTKSLEQDLSQEFSEEVSLIFK
jgi:hypothetical protein